MADEADIALAAIGDQISHALRKIQQNQINVNGKIGSKTCMECGEKIPDPRRKLGFKLCIECAEEKERRKSLFADY